MGVFKRGNSWYARIKINGVLIKKSAGPDKKLAEAIYRELKQEAEIKKLADEGWEVAGDVQRKRKAKQTFGQLAADYMAERQHFKQATKDSYNSALKAYLLPEFGNCPLSNVTESAIRRFQSKLLTGGGARREKLSTTTVNNILQIMHVMITQAVREGIIANDPFLAVKRLQREEVIVDPLSEAELQMVLAAIPDHFRPIFTALAYTGARPNELQALRWRDIDWQRREISITKGRVRGHEGKPKTRSSIRNIPMLAPVAVVLDELKSKQKVLNLDGYVFTTKNGAPINKHLDRIWSKAVKKVGLRHRPSYQLRHGYASMLLLKGISPGYVSKLLGHATLEITYRHYARWIEDASAGQAARLHAAFSEPVSQKVSQPDFGQHFKMQKSPPDEHLTGFPLLYGADEGTRTPEYRNHNPGP